MTSVTTIAGREGEIVNIVRLLNIVKTNYDTGPYVIREVIGPSTEPSYLDHINGVEKPSEPHFYIRCRLVGNPNGGDYWLNGYRLDGTNVWSGDRLELVGEAPGQLELIA